MSPVTGRIILPMIPDLYQNYVFMGDRNDKAYPSPIIIDLRLEIIDLRRRLSETRFILQAASPDFDSSQALNELVNGILKHESGVVSIAVPGTDYLTPVLPYQNVYIGDIFNTPQPFPRIFVNNLPTMASADPTLLFGAYNLYSGSPDPLTLGQPQIIKTLHITNICDVPVGHLLIGQNSTDPLNFGPNRPVPIIVLPLANMADLSYQKIWRGDITNRPVESDDLTNVENSIEEINTEIGDINIELGDINVELGDINVRLGDIDTHLGDIDTHLGDIDIHLGDIDVQLGDLNVSIDSIFDSILSIQTDITTIFDAITSINIQLGDIVLRLDGIDLSLGDIVARLDGIDLTISTNLASGLDHLADLQLQIDAGISSGMDHLATINGRLDALEALTTILEGDITSINSQIAAINSTITTIQSNITTINTTITSIQASITSISASITTINITLTSLQSQINTINTTLTTISSQITTINSTITTIQGNITTINTTLTSLQTQITNITNSFVAGGVVNMNNNRIINLPCDPVADNDAVSFCFLWHTLHDEVTVSWS